jgi:hypothetical protein
MTKKTMPSELRAVLHIFNADEELKRKALPHVDIEWHDVSWDQIFENDFGGGHLAAIIFAKAIWCDQVTTTSDPFDRAFAMNEVLRLAVLQALAIRWSIFITN